VQAIRLDIGRVLGLGTKVVNIGADQFERVADRIRLRLSPDELQLLPEAERP
jgi:hypothetical protein